MTGQVHKSVFRLDLWSPQQQRVREFRRCHDVNKQSADARLSRLSPTPAAVRYGLLNACLIGNKSTTIDSVIDERQLDVLLVTETWHTDHDDVALCHNQRGTVLIHRS